jgi:cell wall-associated NlpC family hydrolase
LETANASGFAAISFTGRFVAFENFAINPAPGTRKVFLFDDQAPGFQHILTAPPGTQELRLAMADNANAILYRVEKDDGMQELALFNWGKKSLTPIWSGAVDLGFDISGAGDTVVFASIDAGESHGVSQVYIWEERPRAISYHLAGRVTDERAQPLALVTISDGKGGSTRTDAGGYFWLSGYPAGPLTLTPQKEGYTFEPAAWNLSVFRDVAGYHFTASPAEKLLEEARLDLGMPYNFNRGCANGEEPCGGTYHGFHAGFCTDLILDAYTALNYDLNFELQQDAYAHPAHYYRWRNARNAHDMWRFLHYSGQMLAPDAAYLPGDIVFFDWSGDGEIDHVALVAAVENGEPKKLLDATGVTDYNPAGLAAELDWLPFHTATSRGHARWDGRYQPVRPAPQAGVSALQMALGGGGIFIRLTDSAGRALSFGENSLPNGYYFDLDWEEVISVLEPAGAYTIEIRTVGDKPAPYRFSLQTLTDGRVTGLITANGIARPLEVIQHTVQIDRGSQGELTLKWGAPRQQASVRGLLRKP